jgi:hypothetical protein
MSRDKENPTTKTQGKDEGGRMKDESREYRRKRRRLIAEDTDVRR